MGEHHQPGFMTGLALLFPITLSTMAIVLLAPILPELLREFGDVPNHEYWVPMILTVPALCVALFSPVAGMLGDYFGRRRLLMLSLIGYAFVGVAPVFLSDIRAIIASRIGAGFWTGAFSVGQFLSPLAVTVTSQRVGGLLATFGVLAIFAGVGAAAALLARPRANPLAAGSPS